MTLVRFRNSRHQIYPISLSTYIYMCVCVENYRAFMVAIFLEFPYSPLLVVLGEKNRKGKADARKQCRLNPKWPVTLDPEIT